MGKSWFPLLIRITKTGEERVILCPEDIPSGKTFKVLEIRYEQKTNEVS